MARMPPPRKPRLFYGYWIVLVGFLCVFLTMGCGNFIFSLFVKSLQTDLGWSRGEIMTAFTIFFLIMGIASPFIGRLVDRYGPKGVILSGALLMGLGFLLLSVMKALWCFYLGYAIIGIGAAAMGAIPASAVVSNWFKRKRGTAIGIMSSGIGAGGLVLSPIVGGWLIPNLGWRHSYLALAILIWVLIIPLALLIVKTKPADMGLYPDGTQAPEIDSAAPDPLPTPRGLTPRMALTTLAFWLIGISFLLSGFSQVGLLQTQVPYLEDIGFPLAAAASALSAVGLGSAVGKLGFGWLCDRIHAKYACAIGLVLQLIAVIILMNSGPASPLAMIWLAAVTLGLGVGSWLPTMSILISSNFGLASYGTIFGVVTFMQSVGVGTGPLMAGYMFDATGSYHWAFIIFAATYAISIPAVLVLRRSPVGHLHPGQDKPNT